MTRIIAGEARGRRLVVADGPTRPTSDRAREGLFSSLESMVGTVLGKRVLDLYAGSGALGLEALSRGAELVVMIEHDRKAFAVCKENIATVGMPRAHVQRNTVESYLAAPGEIFDIAIADPPYSETNPKIEQMLALLASRLADGAVVVVERSSRTEPFVWPEEYVVDRERKYGEATLYYARKDPKSGEAIA